MNNFRLYQDDSRAASRYDCSVAGASCREGELQEA